jgi:hypothetical protein
MLSPTIKLKKKTWDRVKKVSEVAGYSSPQEFVEHIIDKELEKLEEGDSNEKLLEKLKGLGYID